MSADSGLGRWVEIRPARRFSPLDVREVWDRRELVALLAQRDIKVRYKQALLGAAWAVFRPVISALVFVVVFRELLNVETGDVPYWIFAATGLSVWYYFASSVDRCSASLVGDAMLITKVYFPRLVIPLAALIPGLIDLVLSIAFIVVASVVTGIGIQPQIVLVPVLVAALVVVTFGVGVLVATVTVRYRDAQQLVSMAMQLLFFATPIAYPSSSVPSGWQWVYFLNPVSAIVELLRWAVADAPLPGVQAVMSIPGAVVILLVGVLSFLSAERRFADVI